MSATPNNVSPFPRSNDNIPLKFTKFANVRAAANPDERATTWGDMVRAFNPSSEHENKEACPLFNLAVFGSKRNANGSLRHEANVTSLTGVVADYDAGNVTVGEATRRLQAAGIESGVYTTPSHTPDAPRWRVVAPLRKPCAPDEYQELVSILNGALGGILAPESWDKSRAYYVGRVAGVAYESTRVRGACLDEVAALEVITPVGKKSAETPSGLEELDRRQLLERATAETIAELRGALDHLAKHTSRATDYPAWIETGNALASLKGTPLEADAFDLWDRFSAADTTKYDPNTVRQKWDTFNPDNITFRSIFQWAQSAGWVNPKATPNDPIDWTDAGNAALLRQITGGDLRYVVDREEWLFWSGEKWIIDAGGAHAHRQALKVAKHYADRARELKEIDPGNSEERKRIGKRVEAVEKWAQECRNRHRVAAMLEFLSKSEGVALEAKDLDRDPLLLGVQNGVVDLQTGTLRAASRDDFVTKRCAARYEPTANAATWRRVIKEITGAPAAGHRHEFTERPLVAQYLQRVAGYLATGHVHEHKMFFIHGEGSNGKNLFSDAVCHVLGDYAATISVDALMASHYASDGDKATPTMARLVGVRAAFCSETRRGQKLDAAVVKKHTGDLHLAARQLHGRAFEFKKTHKLVMLGNHAPAFDSDENAMYGRIHRIELLRRWNRPDDLRHDAALPDGEKGLMSRLMTEEPAGILAWVVQGAVAYLRDGLKAPDEVKAATLAYFAEQGKVSKWMSGWARCSAREGTRAAELLDDYKRETGDTSMTAKAFSAELAILGVAKDERRDAKYWGLRRLRAPFEPQLTGASD